MPRTKSSFRKKPGYKARTTGKKRGRVKFSRATINRAYLRGKQAGARKKDFKARKAAKAKENAKRRRRDKKINKVVARVLTDMNDDAATMYRQSVDKYAYVLDGQDELHLDGATSSAIQNGQFVNAKSAVLQALVKRNETNFFQIDAFHGMVAPSWKRYDHNDIPVNRDGTNTDNQIHNELGDTPVGNNEALALGSKIDIRAFAQIELPFLPCIPHQIHSSGNNETLHQFDQFCRTNNKIKIKNNYMRFRFFATPNGHVVSKSLANPFDDNANNYTRLEMDGTFTNIEPTFTMAGNTAVLQQTQWTTTNPDLQGTVSVPADTYVQQKSNVAKEYKISARRFAKVRIILYERNQEEVHPVQLKDFMRYHDENMNPVLGMARMPGGNLMVSEEYRLHKRFSSPRKTKRDLFYQADTTLEERLMGGKIVIDKVLNLPMGKETVYTCNPIAGTVLEYDDSEGSYRDDTNTTVNMQTDADETVLGLPVDVNSCENLYKPKIEADEITNTAAQLAQIGQQAEYKPKNKQYGMFMLIYAQRAGVEYDVFQKFQYDK